MGTSGDDQTAESPGEIDKLLDELLSGDSPDQEMSGWQYTEVSADELLLDAPREPSPAERAPAAGRAVRAVPDVDGPTDGRGEEAQQDSPPISPKRNKLLLVVAGISAIVVIAGVVGYWFGTQRGAEVGEPVARRASDSTANATETTNAPIEPAATSTLDVGSTSEPAGSTSDPEATVGLLLSQLEAFDLSRLSFSSGTDRLTAEGDVAIAEFASIVIANPSIPVEVQVSAFTEENAGRNHGLSVTQAESIVRSLIDKGVDPARLVSVGLGGAVGSPGSGATFIQFETSDLDLADELAGVDSTAISLDADGALTPQAKENLDRTADALANHQTSSVKMLGFAYADSPETSHDQSHALLAEAVAYIEGLGVAADRMSTVGMGDSPADLDLGSRVEIAVGAPAEASLAIRQVDNELITFEPGTDEMTQEGLAVLPELVVALALDPARRIEILAHTYSETTTEENHELSHRQGDAIADALVEAGVAEDRLVVVGHGDPEQFASPGRDNYVTFTPLP